MEPMQFAVNSSWIMAIISWVFVLSVILYTKLERRIIKSEDNMIKQIRKLEGDIKNLEYDIIRLKVKEKI